ncbi:MAG: 3-methyl-2-oxobutanoate dehydrogenase subunit VorB [Deltaproteobacteria bacterium]|nr:3-methyl-2-oxobutanoate dehydrogenase subunit VorB [Deltaproteobacteria bacterium]
MKGNDALAEAAVRAGCRLFAGYPITPQSEILEYLSWRLPQAGGQFVQTESEIAGINMIIGGAATGQRVMTSSSGPGFSLKQEGISYLASIELPAVIVDVARFGIGLGDVTVGQGDYFQATKGGGHGGYFIPVYAPASIQENADLVVKAFDTAEKYRTPVIILTDASIGQMCGSLNLPEVRDLKRDRFDWALGGPGERPAYGRKLTDRSYTDFPGGEYIGHIRERSELMVKNEQLWEEVEAADAEVLLVSYGISSRVCKEAVKMARNEGLKLGLIRPIALWPFPTRAFAQYNGKVKGYMSVEMVSIPQMAQDVFIASRGSSPVYALATGNDIAVSENIIENVKAILAGEKEEF